MKSNWADQLKKHEDELSRTERELVSYINETPDKASSMTLMELSDASGVSKPVIINCFRKLGFEDFKAFQGVIEQFFASLIDSLRASREVKSRVHTLEEMIRAAVSVDVNALERLQTGIRTADLKKIGEMLNAASTIYLMGEGTGHYPAHYLAQRLRRYGLVTQLVEQDPRHIPDMLHPGNTRDIIILFHYSDKDDWLRAVQQLIAAKKMRSVLVSGTIHPDIVSASDVFLHIPRGDLHFKNSMAVPMHFANQILLTYELLFEREIDSQLTALERSRSVWDRI